MELVQKIYENDMDVLQTLSKEATELEKVKKTLEVERARKLIGIVEN